MAATLREMMVRHAQDGRVTWIAGRPGHVAPGDRESSTHGPAAPQSAQAWMIADRSPHLWRLRMPAELPEGAHVETVAAADRWGRKWTDRIVFEFWAERPPH